jgi:hypothetical protein
MFVVCLIGVRHFKKALAKKFYFDLEGAISSKKFPLQKAWHFIFCNAFCHQKKKDFYFWPMLHFGYCPWRGVFPY